MSIDRLSNREYYCIPPYRIGNKEVYWLVKLKIEEFRNKRKMNQQQLSKASGVPQPMISQIETGDVANPTIKTLHKLSVALKCTVDDLIEEE
jgi:DNA-binding Xre family transcriptional regulator